VIRPALDSDINNDPSNLPKANTHGQIAYAPKMEVAYFFISAYLKTNSIILEANQRN
jgi:hypothetical protein